MLSQDIRWHVSGPSPIAGEYTGVDGVLKFFGAMFELYEGTLQVNIRDVTASDDHVVVLTAESGTHAGRRVDFTSAHVYTIQGGKATEFEVLYSDAYHQFWSHQGHV
jgi:ketosteroid isomerase-like protein